MNQLALLSRYFWFLTAALTLGSLLLPGYYKMPYPHELSAQAPFRPAVKKDDLTAITERQPKVVLIGDSMLAWGIDENALSQRLGVTTYKIGVPGSASAVWYLILKNTVAEAPIPPKYVVVLFNDTILTIPSYRTKGYYFVMMDDYAREREPLVTQLAFINEIHPAEKLMEQYLPLYSARWKIREGLDSSLRYTVSTALLDCPKTCADNSMDTPSGGKPWTRLHYNKRYTIQMSCTRVRTSTLIIWLINPSCPQ